MKLGKDLRLLPAWLQEKRLPAEFHLIQQRNTPFQSITMKLQIHIFVHS